MVARTTRGRDKRATPQRLWLPQAVFLYENCQLSAADELWLLSQASPEVPEFGYGSI